MRPAGRSNNQVRPVTLTRNYTQHAEGSVLVEFGDTKVLCTASIHICFKPEISICVQQAVAIIRCVPLP